MAENAQQNSGSELTAKVQELEQRLSGAERVSETQQDLVSNIREEINELRATTSQLETRLATLDGQLMGIDAELEMTSSMLKKNERDHYDLEERTSQTTDNEVVIEET